MVTDLLSKLAAALRERDIAISQRDNARREHGDVSPSQPIPQIPPTLNADDIESRIDAWKSVDTQMNDLARILLDGDEIVNSWKANTKESLAAKVKKIREEYNGLRMRVADLINANNK